MIDYDENHPYSSQLSGLFFYLPFRTFISHGSRVFSCSENRSNAPNLDQMKNVLLICYEFSFSSETQRDLAEKSEHTALLDKN
jgi:hypothetical protein